MINLALNRCARILKAREHNRAKMESKEILLATWLFIKRLLFWYLALWFFLCKVLFCLVFILAGWFVSEGNGSFSINCLNYETGTACHCVHQPIGLVLVSYCFWMKQNNNSAGQLITLLFSINLHYCHTQEVPLCQGRDSIKRLPELMYLPCIPNSDTFGSSEMSEQHSRMKSLCFKCITYIFTEFTWGINSWIVFLLPWWILARFFSI